MLLNIVLSVLWLSDVAAGRLSRTSREKRDEFAQGKYARIDYCSEEDERVVTMGTVEALEMVTIAASKIDILLSTVSTWPGQKIDPAEEESASLKDLSSQRLSVLDTYRRFIDADIVQISTDGKLEVKTNPESVVKLDLIHVSLQAMLFKMARKSNVQLEITCDTSWMSIVDVDRGGGNTAHGKLYDGRSSIPASGRPLALRQRLFTSNGFIPTRDGNKDSNTILVWYHMAPPYTTVMVVWNADKYYGSHSALDGRPPNEQRAIRKRAEPIPQPGQLPQEMWRPLAPHDLEMDPYEDPNFHDPDRSGEIDDDFFYVDYEDTDGYSKHGLWPAGAPWPSRLSDLRTLKYADFRLHLEDIFRAYIGPRFLFAFSSMPTFLYPFRPFEMQSPVPRGEFLRFVRDAAENDPDAYMGTYNFCFLVLALYLDNFNWSNGLNVNFYKFRSNFERAYRDRNNLDSPVDDDGDDNNNDR